MLKLNLLPKALQPKVVINIDNIFFVFLFLALVSVGGSFLRVQAKARKTQTELTMLEGTAADQKRLIDELRSKESKRDTTNVQGLVANRKKWNPMLKELTYLLPQDTWITKLLVRNDKSIVDMQINGLAPSQKSVNRVLGRLERSVSFQRVKLNSASANENFTPVLYSYDFTIPDLFSTGARGPASEAPKQ